MNIYGYILERCILIVPRNTQIMHIYKITIILFYFSQIVTQILNFKLKIQLIFFIFLLNFIMIITMVVNT